MNAASAEVGVQLVLTLAAGYGLWRARAAGAGEWRSAKIIIALGFAFRAIAGQLLFWISYLELPFLRTLQKGNGFWFFALDGIYYFELASEAAAGGPIGILSISRDLPSPSFVQLFAVFVALFGETPSVALLLNSICYLLTCAVILLLARRDARLRPAALAALLALSFTPGAILWSLQPLKDPLFATLLVFFTAACVAWQQTWNQAGRRRVAVLAVGVSVILTALIYTISGIRWYVAAALFFATPILVVGTAARAPRARRLPALAAGIVTLILLSQAFVAGSDDIPLSLRRVLTPQTATTGAVVRLPGRVGAIMSRTRSGFDRTVGETTIRAGSLVSAGDGAPIAAMPDTPFERVVVGASAMFLPRAVSEPLGIVDIRGGRGLMAFVEVDTFALDALLVFVLFSCVKLARQPDFRIAPTFVLLLVSCVVISAATAHSVNNFGTLFRLREMVVVQLCLLPLVFSAPRVKSTADQSLDISTDGSLNAGLENSTHPTSEPEVPGREFL